MADTNTVNGLALASLKTRNGLAAASIKTINGLDAAAGGGLVNYIEMPFFHQHVYSVGGTPYVVWFQGTVRLYESGTVVLNGVCSTNRPTTPTPYRLWVGPDASSGAFSTVASPVNGTPVTVTDWWVKPASGSYVHLLFGDAATGGSWWMDKVRVLEYPGGWKYPFTLKLSQSNSDPATKSKQHLTVNRSGNDLLLTGDFDGTGTLSSNGGVFTFIQQVSDFSISSTVAHLNVGPSVVTGFSYSRSIPDSTTEGLRVFSRLTISGPSTAYAYGDFGIHMRAAPTVEEGEDPGA